MAAGRFQMRVRRPATALLALLCAAAAAVVANLRAASPSFASGPPGRCAPRVARLQRASRGGESGGEAREGPLIPFEKLEVGHAYKGTVRSVEDFGAFVSIGTTVMGLLHKSNIADGPVDDIRERMQFGQEIQVWILELKDGKVFFTMDEGDALARRRALRRLRDISRDEWLDGTVTGVAPFGAFVEMSLDGNTHAGLVHTSNMEDEVQVGQKVKVRVLNYNPSQKRVSLSMKELSMKEPGTWEVGQKYTGTVRTVKDFGAFVDIDGSRSGLVHLSNIADEQVANIHDYVKKGQEVEVWINNIRDDGKLQLTMVESRIGSGTRVLQRIRDVSPDEWLQGKVAAVHRFGAFVNVSHYGATGEGLVHVSELRDGFIENVEDEVQVGQRVKVRVLNYNAKHDKLNFSMKPPLSALLSKFEGVPPGQWLAGKVTSTTRFGAFVMVVGEDGSEAAGLVHHTQMTDDLVDSFQDKLEPGQEVKVRIIDLDLDGGRVYLSMRPTDSDEK